MKSASVNFSDGRTALIKNFFHVKHIRPTIYCAHIGTDQFEMYYYQKN